MDGLYCTKKVLYRKPKPRSDFGMCIGDETFQVYSKDIYFCNVFPLLEGMNCEKLEIEYR